jgi:hypothetical protein
VVATDLRAVRYYFDASLAGIGKFIGDLRDDTIHPGHPLLDPPIRHDTWDEVWMPQIGAMGLVVFHRDRHLRTRPAELNAMRRHALRSFYVGTKKDLSNTGYWELLLKHWRSIERCVEHRGEGPWYIRILADRLREVPIPELGAR